MLLNIKSALPCRAPPVVGRFSKHLDGRMPARGGTMRESRLCPTPKCTPLVYMYTTPHFVSMHTCVYIYIHQMFTAHPVVGRCSKHLDGRMPAEEPV